MKIKDLFKENEDIAELPLNNKYFLFIEKGVDFDDKDNVLIEVHEYVGKQSTDFIETLNVNYNINTNVNKLTFDNVKKICTYTLE